MVAGRRVRNRKRRRKAEDLEQARLMRCTVVSRYSISESRVVLAAECWPASPEAVALFGPFTHVTPGRQFEDCVSPADQGHLYSLVEVAFSEAGKGPQSITFRRERHPVTGLDSLVYATATVSANGDGPLRCLLITLHQPLTERMPVPADSDVTLELARQLAAALNHRINNPLFVISATLEDALAEPLDTGLRARLASALDRVWEVASAVRELEQVRQWVSTTYIPGHTMIDLDASTAITRAPGQFNDTDGNSPHGPGTQHNG